MDEDRRVRFFVAPVLFIASLTWGAWFDPTGHDWIIDHFEIDNLSGLIGLVAGGGFALFALGYIIGTLTYSSLRFCFWLKAKCWGGSPFHEVSLPEQASKHVWARVRKPGTVDPKQQLSAAVAFDHGLLQKEYEGVHLWLVRRWNAFAIGVTSTVGLILSFPFGHFAFGISLGWKWYAPVAVFIMVVVPVAVSAWRDNMRMLTFMADVPPAEHHGPRECPVWLGSAHHAASR